MKYDPLSVIHGSALFEFYRGDFESMDGHGLTFPQLYAACEQILVLRFDKKHKRYLYCRILWSK